MKTKRIILFLLLILVSFSSCAKPTEPIDQINSLLTKEDFWYTDLTAISPNLNWIYLINGEKQKTLNLRKRSTQFDIVLGLTQFFGGWSFDSQYFLVFSNDFYSVHLYKKVSLYKFIDGVPVVVNEMKLEEEALITSAWAPESNHFALCVDDKLSIFDEKFVEVKSFNLKSHSNLIWSKSGLGFISTDQTDPVEPVFDFHLFDPFTENASEALILKNMSGSIPAISPNKDFIMTNVSHAIPAKSYYFLSSWPNGHPIEVYRLPYVSNQIISDGRLFISVPENLDDSSQPQNELLWFYVFDWETQEFELIGRGTFIADYFPEIDSLLILTKENGKEIAEFLVLND